MLDLRALVRLLGVLDGQRVQVELLLHAPQKLRRGLEEADPHDMAGFSRPVAGLLDGDVAHALAGGIDARRDHAGSAVLWGAGERLHRQCGQFLCHGPALASDAPGAPETYATNLTKPWR